MRTNRTVPGIKTAEGAPAKHINPTQMLRRSIMSSLLWENEFYEDGESIAKRIADLIPKVDPLVCSSLALQARAAMKLRHMPLYIAREMARHPEHKKQVAGLLSEIIQRPDELSEYVALYWKDGKKPLSGQSKKGLARAFTKFSEYSLAKYNQDRAVKLRDVLFLCHAKPKDKEQEELWKRLIAGTMATPDTWEVEISKTEDKLASWTRLLVEKKLGALALLRNLRNMKQAGVSDSLVAQALSNIDITRVLPFRFISAARHNPEIEPALETSMFKAAAELPKFEGMTTILVDVSGSMSNNVSGKSEITCMDAASALAILLREQIDPTFLRVVTFSDQIAVVPPRRGFALRDAIKNSQPSGATYLGQAVRLLNAQPLKLHRLIVITDEQSHDPVPDPNATHAYMINIASNRNGVGYGKWTHIDGFSEATLRFIHEFESVPVGETV